jgi:hypothetical protein
MKLQNALLFAKGTNYDTLGSAVSLVKKHATRLFIDGKEERQQELQELMSEYEWVKAHRRTPDGKNPITDDTPVQLMLDYHVADDMTDYEIYKMALKNKAFAARLAEE